MSEIRLAGCVIKDDQGRLLLLHRNTAKRQQWEIPGGKLDPGEDERITAARELKEEVGVDVTVQTLLGTKSFVEDGHTMVYTWFLATIANGTPRAMEQQTHDRCEFLDFGKIQEMGRELSPNAWNFVREVVDGHIKF